MIHLDLGRAFDRVHVRDFLASRLTSYLTVSFLFSSSSFERLQLPTFEAVRHVLEPFYEVRVRSFLPRHLCILPREFFAPVVLRKRVCHLRDRGDR